MWGGTATEGSVSSGSGPLPRLIYHPHRPPVWVCENTSMTQRRERGERRALPIDEALPGLARQLQGAPNAVLIAPTGTGKTTRLPPALAGYVSGLVLVLEPRRVAARAAAQRMSQEAGTALGGWVGVRTRFETRVSPRTRIEVITEGVLLRMLQSDPFLERVGAVVFDEAHERSLLSDLGLAMARRLQVDARPELHLIAMSATLEPGPLSAFLDAEVLQIGARLYPVEVVYQPREDDRPMEERVSDAVRSCISDGDVLVFLSGMAEIRRVAQRLEGLDADLFVLHSAIGPQDQDRALRAGPRRRVVLATNIAESSVTLNGIATVVDSGRMKQMIADPRTGLNRLRVVPISMASANQRAGRAGREAPGRCLRMWTERAHQSRPARHEPEVRRADLSGAILQLLAWGETNVRAFPWLEAPAAHQVDRALKLLGALGFVSSVQAPGRPEELRLTSDGGVAADLPVHPRLARMLMDGGHGAVDVVAALSEGEAPADLTGSLVLSGRARPVARQLRRAAQGMGRVGVARAVLAAWPDRVAMRREGDPGRARLVGGGELRVPGGLGPATLFVAVEVSDRGGRPTVESAVDIEQSWLATVQELRVGFDESRGAVSGWMVELYGDLVINRVAARVPPDRAAEALRDAASGRVAEALGLARPAVAEWLARVRFLARCRPDLGLEFEEVQLESELGALTLGCRSFDELAAKAPEALRARLTWDQRRLLETQAPETLRLAGGTVRLRYGDGRPVLAVRMQRLLGIAETPQVGGHPVVLHLLAPNMRVQQITDDLAGFWQRTWPEIRRELRGRYPKHAWPEDPLS